MKVFTPCLILQVREENEMSIPEEADCIRIDSELHVQLFSNGGGFQYPNGFAVEEIVVFLVKVC